MIQSIHPDGCSPRFQASIRWSLLLVLLLACLSTAVMKAPVWLVGLVGVAMALPFFWFLSPGARRYGPYALLLERELLIGVEGETSYRSAPRQFMQVDGRRFDPSQVLEVQVKHTASRRIRGQSHPAFWEVYLVLKDLVILVSMSVDEASAKELGRELNASLGYQEREVSVTRMPSRGNISSTFITLAGMFLSIGISFFEAWLADTLYGRSSPSVVFTVLGFLPYLIMDRTIDRITLSWGAKEGRERLESDFHGSLS